MNRTSLYIEEPGRVEVRSEELPPGKPGQALVETSRSAISAGSELLVFRGQIPEGLSVDPNLPALQGELQYPVSYGYQLVGRIRETKEISQDLRDKPVFAFQPHQSHFWADLDDLIFLPTDLPHEDAVFLPNMETAVNFLHDGAPLVGERVAVIGQGTVGLLTTALLRRIPLTRLVTVDRFSKRRDISMQLGADASFAPTESNQIAEAIAPQPSNHESAGADLIYELSGNPEALNLALSMTGFQSRIVIGSWYGSKRTEIELDSSFHRNRVEIKSSQVSTFEARLRGRWNKDRRLQAALRQVDEIRPNRLISHRFPIDHASSAYKLLDEKPGDTVQIIFTYGTTR